MQNTEYSYLRAPYEELSSTFRTNKRKIEKELSFALSHIKNMHNNTPNLDRHQSLATLQGISSRLSAFKDQLLDLYSEEDVWINNCESRINSLNSPNAERTKILRMVSEHYSRQDNFPMASHIADQAQITPLTEIHFFQKHKQIKESLLHKDLAPALDWCDRHKSKLKKISSPLEFYLKLQKFIEFIRQQNNCGGILYARTHFAKFPEHQNEIQKAMMLLVVGQRPNEFSDYHCLLEESKWAGLVDLFQQEYLRVYSYPTEGSLSIVLRAGLVALKNPLCESEGGRVEQCPLCNKEFQALALKLPYACHSHTRLVCRILRVVMDEHNPPVTLPNGQTYSMLGIKKITKDNRVVCPITGAVFNANQVSKLFIV